MLDIVAVVTFGLLVIQQSGGWPLVVLDVLVELTAAPVWVRQ
jgi:hypothetical protein